ncbi:MAG: hypothetical protein UY35_C0003G0058 [Candidatus Saccharibacteria bacterium GW2011_GWC2_48_9]|nr:MAG: hypothetical protein UY35_C0003G0058 [Candidatus Saccharibacteria bacterium GW2011_GWC2_48_9]HCH34113.1 hypothetical protein [Candidatus Saccharibacteria bacterium]
MTKPMNIASIEKATNKPWEQWVRELDESGARALSHTDLARKLYDQLSGKLENHGWWAQGITVAYEQHIGKRVPGQLSNGLFELAVSKTVALPRDSMFKKAVEWFEKQCELNGQIPMKPRSSSTPKRSTWRCNFVDGSKFSATVEASGEKSKLILSHTAIPSKSEADEWKDFWRDIADRLA